MKKCSTTTASLWSFWLKYGALPSANGVAIASLVRLFPLTENLEYLDRAEAALQSFSTVLQKAPRACPSLLSALDWLTHPVLIRTTAEQVATISSQSLYTDMVKLDADVPERAITLVCKCLKPAIDVPMMQRHIQHSQGM